MSPSSQQNPFVVLTGASRGIGAEYARVLASQGYDLLLVSRDAARLAQLSHELETSARVHAHVCIADLAQPGAAHQVFAESRRYRQTPDMLINNAGFGLFGDFASHPLPRIQAMLHLHVHTVTESIRLFLPGMMERGSGVIINVTSIAGMVPIPYLAEYAATKAFLLSLSEALAREVQSNGVYIQACCPGPTETDFHTSAGFRPSNPYIRRQTSAQVVRESLAAVRKKRPVVTIGWQGKLVALAMRYVPNAILMRMAGRRARPPDQ
ncbi:MAG: SDR family oxidoreductase [Nitrospira sp.]|nr:SDR family oxidoreductase [Nitrospira sp.]MDD9859459.1 SDR family oxidoreductase [Nitrospira sp.]